MHTFSSLLRNVFFAAVLVVGLAACDSNGGDDDEAVVEGEYQFTELRFDVSSDAVQDAEVLDSLVASETYIRFFADGNVILPYEFADGSSSGVFNGTYSSSGGQVTINFTGTPSRLLMPSQITLDVGDGATMLSAEEELNLNLSNFSASYPSTSLAGTLQVTLGKLGPVTGQ